MSLDRCVVLEALALRLADLRTVARIATELVARIRELTGAIDRLEREIGALVADLAPILLALPRCGSLTAAKLVGETAGIGRFHSSAACPVPGTASEALSREGVAGMKTEAIRRLRRRISDEVYRRMRDDETVGAAGQATLAMAAWPGSGSASPRQGLGAGPVRGADEQLDGEHPVRDTLVEGTDGDLVIPDEEAEVRPTLHGRGVATGDEHGRVRLPLHQDACGGTGTAS